MRLQQIIFINRFYYPDDSATSQIASELVSELARANMRTIVVTSRQLYADSRARMPKIEKVGTTVIHRVWTTRFGRGGLAGRFLDYLTFYASSFFKLLQIAKKDDILISKTDPPLISVPTLIAAKLKRCRTINWLQDLFPEIGASLGIKALSGPAGIFLARLRDISVKSAAMNVAIDTSMVRRLRTRVSGCAIRLIPNWADGSIIRPVVAEANPLRAAWGLRDKFVVGYTGNFGRAYDFSLFLQAAQKSRSDASCSWLMVGAGAQRASILNAQTNLDLSNLIIHPYQPHDSIALVLSVPDIHFVSLAPGTDGLMFPSKYYSILAAARPVLFVGDREHPIYREIEEMKCGVALPSGVSADELLERLSYLRKSGDLLRAMGRNSRGLFESLYDRSIAVENWRSTIQSVMDGKAGNHE